jgi:hypothetical protein
LGSLKGAEHSEEICVDGRIILKWILGKEVSRESIGLFWFRTGTGGGSCNHGNEPSDSIKGGKFLVYLNVLFISF